MSNESESNTCYPVKEEAWIVFYAGENSEETKEALQEALGGPTLVENPDMISPGKKVDAKLVQVKDFVESLFMRYKVDEITKDEFLKEVPGLLAEIGDDIFTEKIVFKAVRHGINEEKMKDLIEKEKSNPPSNEELGAQLSAQINVFLQSLDTIIDENQLMRSL